MHLRFVIASTISVIIGTTAVVAAGDDGPRATDDLLSYRFELGDRRFEDLVRLKSGALQLGKVVEWADGGAERNVERLWSEVEEVLNRTLDTHPVDASPHIAEDLPAPDAQPVQPGQSIDAVTPGAVTPGAGDPQFTQPAPIADDPFNPGVSRDG